MVAVRVVFGGSADGRCSPGVHGLVRSVQEHVMSIFTCFGCGERVPLADRSNHKAGCAKFGQRNFVPFEPERVKVDAPTESIPKNGLERWL